MYCIRKFVDCWAVFNLDNQWSRPLTEAEIQVVSEQIPPLEDCGTVAYYTDALDCISNKL